MSDIVERLRYACHDLETRERLGPGEYTHATLEDVTEAIDEIEKLRVALIEINELNSKRLGYSKKIERVIWKALGEKECKETES